MDKPNIIISDIFRYNQSNLSATVGLKVKAGAKQNSVEKLINLSGDMYKYYLKLSIKAAPEKGLANKAIISFLSKEWGLSQDCLEISKGSTSSYKILTLKPISSPQLEVIFSKLPLC